VKGTVIKYDVGKITLDYEKEEDVPEDKKNSHLRYVLINTAVGLVARANYRAHQYKGNCCNPYTMAITIELFKR
jgi:hypothetical protein